MSTQRPSVEIRWGTPAGRWALVATVLGSGLVFLDGSSSNVALPAIGQDLDADVAQLQWIINAYTLSLAALILLGGALADRFGRRRLFLVGIGWFAVASLACGLAPNVDVLVAARALQGVGGALLTPGSLAILQSAFAPGDRGRAVGAWSGLSGIAAAVGPFVGGWLVDVASWRWIFLTNLPVAAAAVVVTLRHVPESRDVTAPSAFDVPGVLLVVAGLGTGTWALIAGGEHGASAAVWVSATASVLSLAAFVAVERRSPQPMLPLSLFSSRQFTAVNLVTVAVYAALSGVLFLLMVHLQQVVGYSALQAGLAAMPITALLLVLSSSAGGLAERAGPRRPMTAGPLLMAAGLLLLLRVDAQATYLGAVLPAVVLFGLGLSLTVAPLTAAVLAAADQRHIGVASGVNNAVARGAGLLAVAALPGLAGLTGDAYLDADLFLSGFRTAMVIAAAVVAAGGALAWALVRDTLADGGEACPVSEMDRSYHCAVDGPPIEPRLSHEQGQASGGDDAGRAG